MKENHMIGITPAHPHPNMTMIRDMGVQWVRQGYPFPFADRIGGKLTDAFKRADEQIHAFIDNGFKVLCSLPGPGSMRYMPDAGKTVYYRAMPEWMGAPSSAYYREALSDAAAFLGEHAKAFAAWWQIANEPDIDIFYGPLSKEENVSFLNTAARGVKRGNPDAQCGINLGYINDYARFLLKAIYAVPDTAFDYLGIDGYMGSWQPGGPDTWTGYIDETYALSGKPIIINEWGFSSLQWGEKYTDLERKNHYNQDVCRNKYWGVTWGKGHTPEEQARYVTRCQEIFAAHPAVIGNFFFRWSDTDQCWQCGEADCPAECAWGCVAADETPKPAYYALKDGNARYFGA